VLDGMFIIASECHATHMTPPQGRGIQSEREEGERRRAREVTSSMHDKD
jgi:hypothetical protein